MAPIIYRGLSAFCTACGAPRLPLSGQSVTLAGKPTRVGGTLAKVFGWFGLVFGLGFALIVALIIGLLAPAGSAAPIVAGLLLSVVALLFSVPLLLGGKRLRKQADGKERDARRQALFALAANRAGRLRAHEAAQALDLPVEDADRLLTDLAKQRGDDVGLEITDQGEVVFVFTALVPPEAGPSTEVRVASPVVPVRVIDAEIEAVEEAAAVDEAARAERRSNAARGG